MVENGRYFIKNPEFTERLVNYNHHDFAGVPKRLYLEVTVVGYDDGGFVSYKNDGDDSLYIMEEYPFERIYTLRDK